MTTGPYFFYSYQAPNFPDYPKYAAWPNAYVVTSNEGGPSPVYAFDRASMLTGSLGAAPQRFTVPDLAGFGFQALTPADEDGATPPPPGSPAYVMRHRDDEVHNVGSNDPTRDFLELYQFTIDFTTPANSGLSPAFSCEGSAEELYGSWVIPTADSPS